MSDLTPDERAKAQQLKTYVKALEQQNQHLALLVTTLIKKFGKETTIVVGDGPPPGVDLLITEDDLKAVDGGWLLEQYPNDKNGDLQMRLVRKPAGRH